MPALPGRPSATGTSATARGSRCWSVLGCSRTVRFHDLRHTCATLPGRGAPVKVGIEMPSQGDVAITLGVYQSVLSDMQESAAREMEGVLS